MAPTVPIVEPECVTAGDTWTWKHSHADFPTAEGWTLSYALAGVDAPAWTASWAVSSGNEWTIVIPASVTDELRAGVYDFTRVWTGSASYAGKVYTVPLNRLTVLPNPQTAAPGDRQTHAERTLAVIEAALEGRMTDDIEAYQIGGRAVTKIPLRELYGLRAQYRLEVWREQHPGQAYPTIHARFVQAAA